MARRQDFYKHPYQYPSLVGNFLPTVSYSTNTQQPYWWNEKQHEPVVYERPLTREQLAQGQAILFDIE
ncbi:hypothetical protein, partial [Proteus mirabilis]|uniref:hypothetical protein n=1 Tax=Proteus mirabilis TaxID=584 RepID=UPI00217EA02C